jgi:arylsulfatase A-like enzyme
MPKTRRWLEDGGTLFANGFATDPVCCPSRATLLTGRYNHNNGVHGNGDALKLDLDLTMERALHDAGYRTGIVGKFLNEWPLDRDPPHFDRWAVFNAGYEDTMWNVQGQERLVTEYATRFISDSAVEFLQGGEASDSQPWFLYLAPSAPHDPWLPEPRYADAPVPAFHRNPAMLERDLADKPRWVRTAKSIDDATIGANRAGQLRTLMSVDDLVDRVMRTVRSLHEDRRTLVFYLSDNGFLWGEHGIAGAHGEREGAAITLITGKRFPYTESIHVPFLVRWPGHVPAGVRAKRFVANVDVAPTILEAAHVTPNAPMDGTPIFSSPPRHRIFLEYFRDPIYPQIPSWRSIRTERLQYVEYFDASGQVSFREYYDLTRDGFQLRNLLGEQNPANDPDVSRLHAEIADASECHGKQGTSACP